MGKILRKLRHYSYGLAWIPAFAGMTLLALLPLSVTAQTVPTSPAQISLSFAPVVKKAAPAVVNIYTKRVVRERVSLSPFMNDPFFRQFFGQQPGMPEQTRERVEGSLGSGVIINADGTIVTAHHVVKDAQAITVVLADRREYEAEVTKRDPQSDLAFLRIHANDRLPFLPLRDSDTLEVGELVLAIGNPFGVGQTVTQGIISALARATSSVSDYQFFIQTDAAINPGNSGGALVDLQGRLIGINTAIYSTSGGSNGVGFAIPANMVKAVAGSQVKEGKVIRPWMGISVQPVTSEMAESLGLNAPRGVIVRKVADDSPAMRAGIQTGDVVLTINGNEIGDDRALQYRISTAGLGAVLDVKLLRKGVEQNVSVTLAATKQAKADTRTLKGNQPLAGLTVATLTPALAQEMGLDAITDEGGVLVVGGRNATGIALQKGDIITEVNGKPMLSAPELERILASGIRSWQFIVKRGDSELTLRITQ